MPNAFSKPCVLGKAIPNKDIFFNTIATVPLTDTDQFKVNNLTGQFKAINDCRQRKFS